jgi:hypothetical protein
LGLLAWGANWSVLLPSTGVHQPPWIGQTPKVLLPILDHAVYVAAWGFLYRALRSDGVLFPRKTGICNLEDCHHKREKEMPWPSAYTRA